MSFKKFTLLVLLGGVLAALLSKYDLNVDITVKKREEGPEEKEEGGEEEKPKEREG
jgi:hypothetical protein